MKHFKKIIIILIVFGVSFFVSNLIKNRKKSYNIDASIEFNKVEHDFDIVEKDKPVSIYFSYQNVGKTPLKIENIVSSCGCTIPVWSEKELLSGRKDSILVKYDSKKLGRFSKEVFVKYNGLQSPEKIKIKGRVLKRD